MADYYLDDQLATGSNDGTSFDDAWQSWGDISGLTAGDTIWVRRRSSDTQTSDIAPGVDGTAEEPIRYIGWPNASETGSATFTQGSRVVSGVSSITPDLDKHATRLISCDADGHDYMIVALAHKIDYDNETATFTEGLMVTGGTSGAIGKIHRVVDNGATGSIWVVVRSGTFQEDEEITDTDTGQADVDGTPSDDGFVIQIPYVGTDASSAACTIAADEHYTEAQAIDDSTWTIKKADWNGDSEGKALITFGSNNAELYISGDNWLNWYNFKLGDSLSSFATVWVRSTDRSGFVHCFWLQSQNTSALRHHDSSTFLWMEYCVIKGNSSGAAQSLWEPVSGQTYAHHVSVYNAGDYGITGEIGFLWGHTIDTGVILPNDDKDLYAGNPSVIQVTDFDIGDQGVQTDVLSNIKPIQQIKIARFGREFGKIAPQYSNNNYGDIDVVGVVAGSGDPYKRTGGSDVVGRVYPATHAGTSYQAPTASSMLYPTVFEIAFWPEDTSEITIRAYVQSVGARTDPTDIFMEVDYISQYYSKTVYRTDTIYSDETISARSDASDWSQYVEVTITPATTAEPVIVRVRAFFYDATGTNLAYVDPAITVN